jgi:cytochrome P450
MRVLAMIEIEDCASAEAIIRSPAFAPLSMQEQYVAIATRTGLDLSATIRMMAFLPPFMRGEEHLRVRREMASRVLLSGRAQRAAVRNVSATLVETLFRDGAEIDLVADFAHPLWRSLSFAILGGAEIWPDGDPVALADQIPSLFATATSLIRRKAIDDAIAAFSRMIMPAPTSG